ncbi:MAG TPA: hypothetical protein VGY54_12345 [Polyangiaceae bacterium]|jgi:hypothetical protein|nr:hypothetical protein [Polyangiaceae bacterium]
MGLGFLVALAPALGCGQSEGGNRADTADGSSTGSSAMSGASGQSSMSGQVAITGASGQPGAGATSTGTSGDVSSAGASMSGSASTGAGSGSSSGAAGDASADVSTDGPSADAAAAGCSGAQTLCWDFEEGKIPAGWMPYRQGDGFPGSLLVDATKPHRGNYSLHAKDYSGGNPQQQGGPKYTITYSLPPNFGPVLWGRVFVYTNPAAPQSHAGLFNARYPRPNSTATAMNALDWYEVATYTQKYMAIWHPPEPPGFPEDVLVSGTDAVVNQWVCLEWLFDGSNAGANQAAQPRVWLDGVELAWPNPSVYPPDAGAPFREKAQNFTELETGIYLYQGLSAVTNWWIDDLGVSPHRIGCL